MRRLENGASKGVAEVCPRCGQLYGIGQSPYCKDQHAAVGRYVPFAPYFDIALGEHVTSLAERWRFMRQQHVDYKDKLSPGQLSARRDRIEQERRERAR